MATVLIILTTVTSYFTAGYLYLNIDAKYQVCTEITAKLLNHAAFPSSITNYQKLNHFSVVLSVQVSALGFFLEAGTKIPPLEISGSRMYFLWLDSFKGN